MKAATGKALFYYDEELISIHAAREGGDRHMPHITKADKISIHAAREGGDIIFVCDFYQFFHFNPRRP